MGIKRPHNPRLHRTAGAAGEAESRYAPLLGERQYVADADTGSYVAGAIK